MNRFVLLLLATTCLGACDTPNGSGPSYSGPVDYACVRSCKSQQDACYNGGVDNNCHGMNLGDYTKCALAYSFSCGMTAGQCEARCR